MLSLGSGVLVLQASLDDGVAFDPFPLHNDGLAAPEVDVGGYWIFGYVDEQIPARNAWVCATVIAALAIAALSVLKEWEEWINLFLGAWVLVSPWALGFGMNVGALWSHVVLGLLIAAIAAWSIWDIRHLPHATA